MPRTAEPLPGAEAVIDHFALKADDRPAFEQRLRAAGQPFESRRLAADAAARPAQDPR